MSPKKSQRIVSTSPYPMLNGWIVGSPCSMLSGWISTGDLLPTIIPGEQVKVLFCRPTWAATMVGMYTHFVEGGKWSEYDQIQDRYLDWESNLPTHWMRLPSPSMALKGKKK